MISIILNSSLEMEDALPRVSQAEKARNHEKIVEEAAKLVRLHGIEGLGIAELMKSVGMTHGGFYRHFKTKEDLAIAAIDLAFDRFCRKLEEDIAASGSQAAIGTFVKRYLSIDHVRNPEIGCPAAALGGEAGHCTEAEKRAISNGIARLHAVLERGLAETSMRDVLAPEVFLGMLIGAIVQARSLESELEITDVLQKTKEHLQNLGVSSGV